MALILGKRKRRDEIRSLHSDKYLQLDSEVSQRLQELLQGHFEATFTPLEGISQPLQKDQNIGSNSTEDAESEWEGLSDADEVGQPQVVHHGASRSSKAEVSKEERKTFMTTRPPSTPNLLMSIAKRKQPDQVNPEEAVTDAANLKKDLALQRLLKESHLLESGSSLSLYGQNRHKALDLRLQDLGSKSSIYKQESMPLAQRKGIVAKAVGRDKSRRREAKENGIILEKAGKGKKRVDVKRQRGIGTPSVGKFQGGMLKLSQKDVAEIEGPKETKKRKR